MIVDTLLPPLLFIWGAALGSFLNVVILRSIAGQSLTGRSRCPGCGRQLRWFELIPIFSYIFLRGRSRCCHRAISVQYPIIELATGLFTLIILTPFPVTLFEIVAGLVTVAIAALLVVLFVVDLYTMYLPDRFIIPLGILAVVHVVASAYAASASFTVTLTQAALGALIGSGLLGLLWLATCGRGLGLGDVKLMMPLGFFFGPPATAVLLFIAFISGGLLGIILIATRRATLKTAVPFGPFLIGAAFLLLIYSNLTSRFIAFIFGT